ncbi:MAG: hypothetical protein NZ739_12220 [Verrucomicrobiae bacterium]|nr:hypothetical protein [Verrucomicrobiae bacterium]
MRTLGRLNHVLALWTLMGPIKVSIPNENQLVITKSRAVNFIRISYTAAVWVVWYYVLIKAFRKNPYLFDSCGSPYLWFWAVGMFAPIYFIWRLVRRALGVLQQGKFVFDRSRCLVSVDGKVIGHFEEIEAIQIEEFGQEAPLSYRLTIKMVGGRTIEIEPETINGLNLTVAAEMLAEHIDREIVHVKSASGLTPRRHNGKQNNQEP